MAETIFCKECPARRFRFPGPQKLVVTNGETRKPCTGDVCPYGYLY